MKFKFLKAVYLSTLMAICSNANAGLITGTDIVIDTGSISYIEFLLTDTGDINWSVTGEGGPNYNFALFAGSFGNFQYEPLVLINHWGYTKTYSEVNFSAGIYTFAVGMNLMTAEEARTGMASTPTNNSVLYNYSLSGDTLQTSSGAVAQVPEPTTLAIFALGVLGLASRKFKKNI
tara:strand:+ start:417 stop:944 length:528 start_codon:yes stop_codon:yes gene_type:complete